jgi:uncharacterized protein (TIGR03435 family)
MESMDQGDDRNSFMLTVLAEQLGLSFKAERASIQSLVVEHAERVPTPN